MGNESSETPVQAIDLTPMLDVVFILLIFFVVSTSFVKLPGVEVERSPALTAEPRMAAMLVAIDGDNAIWVDKAVRSPTQVKTELARLQADTPQGGLVIQVDRRAHIGQLALVADIAEQLGISNISVATLDE